MQNDEIIPFEKPRLSHMVESMGLVQTAEEVKYLLPPDAVLPGKQVGDYPIYIGLDIQDYNGFGVTYLNTETVTVGSSLEFASILTLVSYAVTLVDQGIISDVYIFGMVPKSERSTHDGSLRHPSDCTFGLGPDFDVLAEKVLSKDPTAGNYDDSPGYLISQSVMSLTHDPARSADYLISAAIDVILNHCPIDFPIDVQKVSYDAKLAFLNAFRHQAYDL